MTTQHSSPSIVCALAFALVVAPAFLARAQTAADASSSNAAPAAPAAPAATPAPAAPADTNAVPAPAPTERPATYTMAKGDSLDSVAKKFGTSIHALAKLNNIPKSMYRKLAIGKVLQIPPATSDTTTK
jgi:LysM repeat protein